MGHNIQKTDTDSIIQKSINHFYKLIKQTINTYIQENTKSNHPKTFTNKKEKNKKTRKKTDQKLNYEKTELEYTITTKTNQWISDKLTKGSTKLEFFTNIPIKGTRAAKSVSTGVASKGQPIGSFFL